MASASGSARGSNRKDPSITRSRSAAGLGTTRPKGNRPQALQRLARSRRLAASTASLELKKKKEKEKDSERSLQSRCCRASIRGGWHQGGGCGRAGERPGENVERAGGGSGRGGGAQVGAETRAAARAAPARCAAEAGARSPGSERRAGRRRARGGPRGGLSGPASRVLHRAPRPRRAFKPRAGRTRGHSAAGGERVVRGLLRRCDSLWLSLSGSLSSPAL